MREKTLLKDSYDYEDYDVNVVVLSEEDLIDLNLMEKYKSVGGSCCKSSGKCSKKSTIEIKK
ncbi:hypothetical protein [Clostridium massiliamazoniense]|uniref:hypothetical protein n=1 Tax=Clostridium massiliamazoniense TaxID=1347366 RepID=UPI0006D80717|nr:hypothetical protein [Clostridium massiliamazoniense]